MSADQEVLIKAKHGLLEGGGREGQWLQITEMCINDTVFLLSFCRYILTSEEDIRWDSGITSGEGG